MTTKENHTVLIFSMFYTLGALFFILSFLVYTHGSQSSQRVQAPTEVSQPLPDRIEYLLLYKTKAEYPVPEGLLPYTKKSNAINPDKHIKNLDVVICGAKVANISVNNLGVVVSWSMQSGAFDYNSDYLDERCSNYHSGHDILLN